MPASSRTPAEDQKATFIFKGTVKRRRSATIKDLPVDDRTLVVTVDHIIVAPPALAYVGGHDLTVRLGKGPAPKAGQEMVFHTNGWIFGDGIAVQSVSHEPIQKSHTPLLSRGGDPVEHKRRRDMRERFNQASVVVSGRVSAVRLPPELRATRRGMARAAAGVEPTLVGPVSEHDAHWREAVIEVDDVHKGDHAKRDIVIRFPASTDVRWYKAPKFQTGQQGFFMLHRTVLPKRTQPSARRRPLGATAAAGPEAEATEEVYTALFPIDFQPYHDPGGLRTLMEARRAETGV